MFTYFSGYGILYLLGAKLRANMPTFKPKISRSSTNFLSSLHYTFWGVFLFILSIIMIVVFFYQIEPALGDEKQEIALQQPIILSLPNAPTREEVANYIGFKALEMKLDPAMVLRIAKCESGLNYLSKNKNSTASGIFQFLNSTWSSTRKQMGVEKSSQFNAQDNIDTAIWKIKNGGIGAWNESKKCWK